MKRAGFFIYLLMLVLATSCTNSHIKEKKEWNTLFESYGIKDGAFIVRDHVHDRVYYNDLDNCSRRYLPASTFKVFLSMVGLEEGITQDDRFVIPFTGTPTNRAEWNKDLSLREALKVSSEPYYKELARRIGKPMLQHYLDTLQYGNRTMGDSVSTCWTDNTLQITADEQVGLMKKLYFNELPLSDRTHRITRSMMLQEETPDLKLFYKTGWGSVNDTNRLWVVGFLEVIQHVKEHKNAMNKSDIRMKPYFFALNFSTSDTTKDWASIRLELMQKLLDQAKAL